MEGYESLNLKDFLNIVWSSKFFIILIVTIVTIGGYFFTKETEVPIYNSSTTLVLVSQNNLGGEEGENESKSGSISSDLSLHSSLVATYSEIIRSKSLIRQVKNNLNLEISDDEIRSNLIVRAVSGTGVLEISVNNRDPKIAVDVANEMAKVFSERIKSLYKIDNIEVLDPAEESNFPMNINHKKDIIIFVLIGSICAGILVFLRYVLDSTVDSTQNLEEKFNVPVLVTMPIYSEKAKK